MSLVSLAVVLIVYVARSVDHARSLQKSVASVMRPKQPYFFHLAMFSAGVVYHIALAVYLAGMMQTLGQPVRDMLRIKTLMTYAMQASVLAMAICFLTISTTMFLRSSNEMSQRVAERILSMVRYTFASMYLLLLCINVASWYSYIPDYIRASAVSTVAFSAAIAICLINGCALLVLTTLKIVRLQREAKLIADVTTKAKQRTSDLEANDNHKRLMRSLVHLLLGAGIGSACMTGWIITVVFFPQT